MPGGCRDAAKRRSASLKAAAIPITPSVLAGFLRNRETTKVPGGPVRASDIDFHTARRILERRKLDALSIVCKAAGFDLSLYLTFAVLILDRERPTPMGRAREYANSTKSPAPRGPPSGLSASGACAARPATSPPA